MSDGPNQRHTVDAGDNSVLASRNVNAASADTTSTFATPRAYFSSLLAAAAGESCSVSSDGLTQLTLHRRKACASRLTM